MGVSPIDLQAMYANMNNVARSVSHQQQGAVLAQQLQESRLIQQNAEKAAAVQRAANNESKSTGVNDEGHNGSSSYKQGGGRGRGDEKDGQTRRGDEIRESYLGVHIDIER